MNGDLAQKIKNQVDIIDVAHALSIDNAKYSSNICCPFHDDSSPSFRFYKDNNGGHFKCYSDPSCNDQGNDVFALVQKSLNVDFKGALNYLADHLSIERRPLSKKNPEEEAVSLANYFFKKNLPDSYAFDYAIQRGITEKSIDTFSLGYAMPGNRLTKYGHKQKNSLLSLGLIGVNEDRGEYDFFRNRLVFPIHSPSGKLIGFSGRVLDDRKPKYLNSSESNIFIKSSTLYNLNRIPSYYDQVIVVEGYLDVIGLWQLGFKNAVCTMGISLSEDQLNLLLDKFESIVFMFDGDKAGKSGGWEIAKTLITHTDSKHSFKFVFLDEGIDPFDLSLKSTESEIDDIIENAYFLSDFIINEVKGLISARDSKPEQLGKLISKFENFINLAPEGLFRDMVSLEISNIANCNIEKIPVLDMIDCPHELLSDIEDLIESKYKNTKIQINHTNRIRLYSSSQTENI